MRRYILYLSGLLRLRFGFCPWCNSSPPDPACPVCLGDQKYWGKNVDENKRAVWKSRFMHEIGRL